MSVARARPVVVDLERWGSPMSLIRLFVLLSLPIFLGVIHLSMCSRAIAGDRSGTTLAGAENIQTTITRTTTFPWTVEKSAPPNQIPYVILNGMNVPANFTIIANRGAGVSTTVSTPVAGQVCIANTGSQLTQGLTIYETLQVAMNGGFQDLATQTLPVFLAGELAAGETRCYNYQFDLTLDPAQSYRGVALVSIQNYVGIPGSSAGIVLVAPVQITEVSKEEDSSALLSDSFQCPPGFVCDPTSYAETLSGSKTISYQLSLTNQSAVCGQTFVVTNSATVTGSDSRQVHSASATIQIFTGTCHR